MPPASLFQLEIKMNDDLRCEMDLEETDYEDWVSSPDDQDDDDDIDELLDNLLGEDEGVK